MLARARSAHRGASSARASAKRIPLSVNSVNYVVVLGNAQGFDISVVSAILVPKGPNFGSERAKLWFRKGQTIPVPDRPNVDKFLIGQTSGS